MPRLESLLYGYILPASQAYRPPQKCNVPHSDTALWSIHGSSTQHRDVASRPSASALASRNPASLAPCRPLHPRITPPRPPPAARCVPPDCASESDASNLLSLLATQQRATALAPTSAASQLIRNASLSTAHPLLAQQQPLQHTLSCTPSFGPAFNIFSRLSLPLSSQQSLSSFTHCGPAGGVPPKAKKKNTFPAGRHGPPTSKF